MHTMEMTVPAKKLHSSGTPALNAMVMTSADSAITEPMDISRQPTA